jgi:hypothetical protein
MKRGVAAEQNHSSIAAYLGERAAWTIGGKHLSAIEKT